MPALGRLDANPGPWRSVAVLLDVTLLLAAVQRVLEGEIAPGLGLSTARALIVADSVAWVVLMAAWVMTLMPILVWGPLERRAGSPTPALERFVVNIVIVLAFLIYFLASTLDLSLASIGAASGVLTIVLGFALQNIILDLFSGILLNLEK